MLCCTSFRLLLDGWECCFAFFSPQCHATLNSDSIISGGTNSSKKKKWKKGLLRTDSSRHGQLSVNAVGSVPKNHLATKIRYPFLLVLSNNNLKEKYIISWKKLFALSRKKSDFTIRSGLCGLTSCVATPSFTKTAWESPSQAVKSKLPLMRLTTAVVPPFNLCVHRKRKHYRVVRQRMNALLLPHFRVL